jgi:hypothetical protein
MRTYFLFSIVFTGAKKNTYTFFAFYSLIFKNSANSELLNENEGALESIQKTPFNADRASIPRVLAAAAAAMTTGLNEFRTVSLM